VIFVNTSAFIGTNPTDDESVPDCPLSGSVYNRFSQAYLRLPIGEIGGNSTKRPFRLPLDIATRLEKWIQSSNTAGSLPDLAIKESGLK
jgi:hypothetical protein